ncbi:MAG: sigma E protease regulator RseP [Oleispira antarctica]|uniref:Zinc metalloprotease n=1 Tax=Oleispira antarctica RB-8 TaxID=698738 RepID=R4YSP8_OLEAN|nr:sigma E protease regulator RseP [Oleispira antarctica]MBQ0791593.1 sigma E protease regulator RseP [Oleispira antarctica]CCK75199.1 Putative membrane-associated zinc metallopeptidase M50 [Oleispira antarctica RB-8]
MSTLLSFILAISILVVIHEFGHFWVARRCGVKVLRFSVGFGKPLWSYTDKLGTEFSIAPIPLGGYVKMLDQREGDVKPEELHQAFNQKTVWQRIAIASAGPIANFIFAVFAYWSIFMMGTSGLVPVLGQVEENSPAYEQGLQAGDRIVAVADVAVDSFQEVSWQLISFIGETTELPLVVEDSQQVQRSIRIPIERWLTEQEAPDPMKALGIQPRQLPIEAIIGQVVEKGAAAQAGLVAGDKVVGIIGADTFIEIADWRDWVAVVRDNPEQSMDLLIERDGKELSIQLIPALKSIENGKTIGYVGAGIDPSAIPEIPSDWIAVTKLGPIDSLVQATIKTQQLIVFTLESLWKMISGDLSVKNLSGPITIAKVADSSASNGLQAFIGFLALLSVSLGVLNLLPIPVLDGGHIMFYAIEAIRGRALSERTQIMAVQVGMVLLMSLMVIAFYNDISRL